LLRSGYIPVSAEPSSSARWFATYISVINTFLAMLVLEPVVIHKSSNDAGGRDIAAVTEKAETTAVMEMEIEMHPCDGTPSGALS
jgi:hypothetical protein